MEYGCYKRGLVDVIAPPGVATCLEATLQLTA
jgi:hypothetical protein